MWKDKVDTLKPLLSFENSTKDIVKTENLGAMLAYSSPGSATYQLCCVSRLFNPFETMDFSLPK
jgi:hypothetical protein